MIFTRYFLLLAIFLASISVQAVEDFYKNHSNHFNKKKIFTRILGGSLFIAFFAWYIGLPAQLKLEKTGKNKKKRLKTALNLGSEPYGTAISKGENNFTSALSFSENSSNLKNIVLMSYFIWNSNQKRYEKEFNLYDQEVDENSVFDFNQIRKESLSIYGSEELLQKSLDELFSNSNLSNQNGENSIHNITNIESEITSENHEKLRENDQKKNNEQLLSCDLNNFLTEETYENQNLYLQISSNIFQKIYYFLNPIQNTTPQENIKRLNELKSFRAETLPNNIFTVFNKLSLLQKSIFKNVFEAIRLEIKEIYNNKQSIPCIFYYEIETFKNNLDTNNVAENDQLILIEFFENMQCLLYKHIIDKNIYIDLYAPEKIHAEQLLFLDKLINISHSTRESEKQKFSILHEIYENLLKNLDTTQQIKNFMEEVKAIFSSIIEKKDYSEEVKEDVLWELNRSDWKKIQNNKIDKQKEFIKNKLTRVQSVIVNAPNIDQDYIDLIQYFKEVFVNKINNNVLIFLYKILIEDFKKKYNAIQQVFDIALKSYEEMQKFVIEKDFKNSIFLNFNDIYAVKYNPQMQYIDNSLRLTTKKSHLNEIYYNAVLLTKNELLVVLTPPNFLIDRFLDVEMDYFKKNLDIFFEQNKKIISISDEEKKLYIASFMNESQEDYKNTNVEQKLHHKYDDVRRGKQIKYVEKTKEKLQKAQAGIVAWHTFLINVYKYSMQNFYSFTEEEVRDIIRTGQKYAFSLVQEKNSKDHFILHQNSMILQLPENIKNNIPIPQINKESMKKLQQK